jgi:hypothetical protein
LASGRSAPAPGHGEDLARLHGIDVEAKKGELGVPG